MIQAILQIYYVLKTKPEDVRGVCCLPPKPAAKAKTKAPPKAASIFEINVEEGKFGFHLDAPESREGAVKWLTDWDKEELIERGIWGGKKVVEQNATAKSIWYAGEKIADAARTMGLSISWIEKRYWAFGAALSKEVGEGQ